MRLALKLALTFALMSMAGAPLNCSFVSAAETDAKQPAASTTNAESKKTNGTYLNLNQIRSAGREDLSAALPIDRRVGILENRLNNALLEGRVTADELENYHSALTRISEEEAQSLATTGKLGQFEEEKLNIVLDSIEKNILAKLHDRKQAIADLPARLSDIEQAVAVCSELGRLSPHDAKELKEELQNWRKEREEFLADGRLSYSDSLVLSIHLDHITDHFGKSLQPRPIGLPDFKTLVAGAESAMSADQSKVGADAMKDFKRRIDDDKTAIGRLSTITNPWLKLEKTLDAAADLEEVRDRLQVLTEGKNTAVPVAQRETEIDQAISNALLYGRLTPPEAHELIAELKGIISEDKQTGSSTAAAGSEPPRVALELERLSAHVNRAEHAPRLPWAGVPAFAAALDQRIIDAEKSGRITSEQAKQYKTSADNIAHKLAEFKVTDSRLDATEALSIAMQLESVAVDLHNEMKDRSVKGPDVEALQKQLDKLIADSVESGSLRVDDHLTSRLARINALKEQHQKASPQGLDDRAKLVLANDIQHTMADILAEVHHDPKPALSLDAQLLQLRKLIGNAVAGGMLPVERGTQYKSAVDTLQSQLWEDKRKADGISASDALAVANDIAILNEQLEDELREMGSLPPQLIPRYRQLVNDIGRALASARITTQEADGLMFELNNTALTHAQAAASQGGMSRGEGLRLSLQLERIATELESKLRDESVPVGNISATAMHIDTSLANGLASGKLPVKDAQRFETKLEQILSASAVYGSTGGGMSYPEAVATYIELDRLSSAVNRAVDQGAGKGTDITTRQALLHKRIKEELTSGKLTQKDADSLLYDLDRIAESEASFRVSDEGLNFAEALTLALDLDRLNSRLESVTKATPVSLKGKPR